MNQINWVRTTLKRGVQLTPMVALNGCGTMRLAAIIHTLRGQGLNILTTIKETADGHRYASYKLVKGK